MLWAVSPTLSDCRAPTTAANLKSLPMDILSSATRIASISITPKLIEFLAWVDRLVNPYVQPVLYVRRPGDDQEHTYRFPDDDPFFSEVCVNPMSFSIPELTT